jgi:hypothetical protein
MKRESPCPRCQSEEINCHCNKTECVRCGNPVGNPTFRKCQKCYEAVAKFATTPPPPTDEQIQTMFDD